MLLLSFQGAVLPGYVRGILARHEAAGVFLTRANLSAAAAARRAGGAGTIVAVDQEGGAQNTVPGAGPITAEPAAGGPPAVEREARAAGRALRSRGVTLALAPVADVPTGAGSFIAGRAYPGAPTAVAARVAAAVRGFRAGGVPSAVKHFPGLGAATGSTDDAAESLPTPGPATLRPFAAAIRAGAPVVMIGHGRYPALDPDHPASRSVAIIGGLLRRRLGFRGVVMTDSMEARASLAGTTLERAVVGAVRAGADLLLLTGPGSWIRAERTLGAAARRFPAFARRLRAAEARIASLRP